MINHSLSMSLVNVDVTDAGGVSVFPLPQLSNLLQSCNWSSNCRMLSRHVLRLICMSQWSQYMNNHNYRCSMICTCTAAGDNGLILSL